MNEQVLSNSNDLLSDLIIMIYINIYYHIHIIIYIIYNEVILVLFNTIKSHFRKTKEKFLNISGEQFLVFNIVIVTI
jgi:hypothetical protein